MTNTPPSPQSNPTNSNANNGDHALPERLPAYLVELGVAPDQAVNALAQALTHRGTVATATAPTLPDVIAHLNVFLDEIAHRATGEHRRLPAVQFALARHLGPLLSTHPQAPTHPSDADALVDALIARTNAAPGGVLPTFPQQEMPRQPLGALPAVLRGQFWTTPYRVGRFGVRRDAIAQPSTTSAPSTSSEKPT